MKYVCSVCRSVWMIDRHSTDEKLPDFIKCSHEDCNGWCVPIWEGEQT